MNYIKPLFGPMRLPFLILTPACVLLGLAVAIWTTGGVNWFQFALVMIGAVAAHISVNAFNEYFDFKSGLDSRTERTPFSGGSGTLPALPEMERPALMISVGSFALTAAIGLYFVAARGIGLLPLGILGLLTIYAYTPWLTRIPVLCLVAPGLGFGPLMVMGTTFALTGEYSWSAFIASLIPFFLVSNLLLLNQFPDVEADRSVGRHHFPITLGRTKSALIYIAFLALAYLSLIIGVLANRLPLASLLGLLTVLIAIPLIQGLRRHAEEIKNLIPNMGQNVLVNILTPILVAIGIFFS